MRPRDQQFAARLDRELNRFAEEVVALPGITLASHREIFIEQLLESVHRVRYPEVLRSRELSTQRTDPASNLFDPIRAAILQSRYGNHDEACWLVFLFVLFGRHAVTGYQLTRDVYGALGNASPWTWGRVSRNVRGFREWLDKNEDVIKRRGGKFGNHRKYELLSGRSEHGAGATVESYVDWVDPPRTHEECFRVAEDLAESDPRRAFAILYRTMAPVIRFGRLARLDYLAMLGKLGLARVEPDRTYLSGATGPLCGARRLFAGSPSANLTPAALEDWLAELDRRLGVGMQVLEDALCNWNKSPARLIRFRG